MEKSRAEQPFAHSKEEYAEAIQGIKETRKALIGYLTEHPFSKTDATLKKLIANYRQAEEKAIGMHEVRRQAGDFMRVERDEQSAPEPKTVTEADYEAAKRDAERWSGMLGQIDTRHTLHPLLTNLVNGAEQVMRTFEGEKKKGKN